LIKKLNKKIYPLKMTKISKRFNKGLEEIDLKNSYELDEAIKILKQFPGCKFDETVELVSSLNIDPKKSDQIVRGSVVLPHGTGKDLKIIAFCKDEKIDKAKEAGAMEAGNIGLIKKIEQGWLDFDAAVATPEMMKDIGKLGKVLGPRGMMPNPKAGTLSENIIEIIKQLKSGKIEFKIDSGGNMHVPIGKLSFNEEKLVENAVAMIDTLKKSKPSSVKVGFIKKLVLTSSMGPGIKIKI